MCPGNNVRTRVGEAQLLLYSNERRLPGLSVWCLSLGRGGDALGNGSPGRVGPLREDLKERRCLEPGFEGAER